LNEDDALTALAGAPLLGSVKVQLLLKTYGSALASLSAGPKSWSALPGFGPKTLESWQLWHASGKWEENRDLAHTSGIKIISFTNPAYPKHLRELPDRPIVLYVKGQMIDKDNEGIAVVGTRQPSIYGMEMAHKISYDLAALGYTVVSGLARGIDTAAHISALKRGRTIAVIGSGLLDIYPRDNMRLASEIMEKGALISEFPLKTPPDRTNFPQRNRIVSGMTLGTLLIEAPMKSGAMITMSRAYEQKRKLFAIPGRADSDNFRGNLSLIKEKKAYLAESARDIVCHFEELTPCAKNESIKMAAISLDTDERELLSLLPQEELAIDKILEMTKLPIMKINVLLMSLLLKKAIKEYPGKIYKKLI